MVVSKTTEGNQSILWQPGQNFRKAHLSPDSQWSCGHFSVSWVVSNREEPAGFYKEGEEKWEGGRRDGFGEN